MLFPAIHTGFSQSQTGAPVPLNLVQLAYWPAIGTLSDIIYIDCLKDDPARDIVQGEPSIDCVEAVPAGHASYERPQRLPLPPLLLTRVPRLPPSQVMQIFGVMQYSKIMSCIIKVTKYSNGVRFIYKKLRSIWKKYFLHVLSSITVTRWAKARQRIEFKKYYPNFYFYFCIYRKATSTCMKFIKSLKTTQFLPRRCAVSVRKTVQYLPQRYPVSAAVKITQYLLWRSSSICCEASAVFAAKNIQYLQWRPRSICCDHPATAMQINQYLLWWSSSISCEHNAVFAAKIIQYLQWRLRSICCKDHPVSAVFAVNISQYLLWG